MPGSLISSLAAARFRFRQGSFGSVSAPVFSLARFGDSATESLFVALWLDLQDAIATIARDRMNSFMWTTFPRLGLEGHFQRIESEGSLKVNRRKVQGETRNRAARFAARDGRSRDAHASGLVCRARPAQCRIHR